MKKIPYALPLVLLCAFALIFPAAAAAYPDVPEQEWYYTYVTELSSEGIVDGYPDGKFYPDQPVQFDQGLKLILLSAGWPSQPATAESWAGGYLNLAQEQGFLSREQSYDMTAPITRLEVAQLAARALGVQSTLEDSPFADCDDQEVLALFENQVIEGIQQGDQLVFSGELPLRRSEVSAIVWRMNQLRHQLAEPSEPTVPVPPETPIDPNVPVDPPNPEVPGTGETQPPEVPGEPSYPAWMPTTPSTITYNSYVLEVLPTVPAFSFDASQFAIENGRMTCNAPGVRLVHGIDVSSYQELIDWERVRNDGIDFAILRVGYRGYGTGSMNKDSYFDLNAYNATNAGLDVGVYFFSQAITVEEALEEADFVLDAIRNYNITGPVVFDWEVIGKDTARTYGLETQVLTDAANAFCQRIADAGYSPMIYFNSYAGYVKYDLSQIVQYPFWFAQYSQQPSFYYDFQMWQYSSSGKVDGIKGNVDMDVWMFHDFNF